MTATSATWGPGDEELAIERERGIWLVRPDGTGLRRLFSPPGKSLAREPAWSPDGRTILFSGGAAGIFAMRSDGSGAHAIVKPKRSSDHLYVLSAPAWSPNGKRIAFVQQDLFAPLEKGPLIKTANPDGGGQRTAIELPGEFAGLVLPTWSPDSSSIAVGAKGQRVFVVPSAGGKRRLLYGGDDGPTWWDAAWGPAGT